jgi:hypothetical protein
MCRSFTPRQSAQNAAFLRIVRRTGNVRDACRALGVHRATYTRRRAKCAAFAADWDAALAVASAALAVPAPPTLSRTDREGEPRATRTAGGRLQLRRHRPGRITRAHEQAFLSALAATANVRLSAAAAGFSHSAFYRRREASPAFAREMRLALQTGYDRIEFALLAGFDPGSHADDAWRRNDQLPMPSMTVDQALMLLQLHQREARLFGEPTPMRRRRGEPKAAYHERLALMHEARIERDREAFRIAEAERRARGIVPLFGGEIAPLPALDQVIVRKTPEAVADEAAVLARAIRDLRRPD